MALDSQQEIVIATVIGVEGLPCSIVGQKKIFTIKGEGLTGNLQLPWNLSMTWLEEQLAELVTGNLVHGMFKSADLINPDEPDQILKVMIACEMLSVGELDALQNAIFTTQVKTPNGIRTNSE
jgi:hypothetical protein